MKKVGKIKILHLEDLASDAELVGRILQKGKIPFERKVVPTKGDYEKALKEFSPDIIFSDHTLANFNSIHALKMAQDEGLNIPFILVTGTISEEFAVEVMKLGASDYVLKDNLEKLPSAMMNAIEKNRVETERQINLALNTANEKQFRHALNSMLVGVQIHDFNWRYLYVNDAVIKYSKSTREKLMGHTLMEIFPGIEQSHLFKVLQQCMQDRTAQHLETEFTFPDGSCSYFEISVQPIDEGISIQSVDRSELRKTREKLINVNRLLAFGSAVNQSIAHIDDVIVLLSNTCKIAVDIGLFKASWVSLVDSTEGSLNILSKAGDEGSLNHLPQQEIIDQEKPFFAKTLTAQVLKTNLYAVSNDIQNDPAMDHYQKEFVEHEIKSCIMLPVYKSGSVAGVFGFYSVVLNYFGDEEITLLKEVSLDIYFALENIEKSKKLKETEELLVMNEKRFRALIENGTEVITLTSKYGAIIYSSPSITRVFGYSTKEFSSMLVFDIIHPDDMPAFIEKRNKLLKTPGESFDHQLRIRHKDGQWLYGEITVTNLLEEPGIHALVSNLKDITEKKEMEKQREFDRCNLNALINNTNDLMWSMDRNFDLITSNKPFDETIRSISGKILEKGDNMMLASGFTPERLQQYQLLCERAFNGETFTEAEHRSSPYESWSEISYFPIREGDVVVGTACHSRNITERKAAEIKLEQENTELVKANSELDRFVYSVSHDLRAPLNSVLGLAALLDKESKDPATIKYTGMIRTSVQRLDEFVKNILNYSYNNRTQLEIKKIAVQKSIEEIIASFSNMQGASGIFFDVAINETQSFYSDRPRFNAILENLISNAIKYHKKEVQGRFIKITGTSDNDQLHVLVADNGIGIAPEHHPAVFNMFFRLPSTEAGSGIGLYMVKEIVEKLKGTISIESQPGTGTTFSITLNNFNTITNSPSI